jgi:hypothetical protein
MAMATMPNNMIVNTVSEANSLAGMMILLKKDIAKPLFCIFIKIIIRGLSFLLYIDYIGAEWELLRKRIFYSIDCKERAQSYSNYLVTPVSWR